MSARRVAARTSVTVASLAAVLTLLGLTAGVASAAVDDDGGVGAPAASTDAHQVPAVLAHTGLDLTAPIVVGLAVLLLGTALVAWAVLRGSGRSSHATGD